MQLVANSFIRQTTNVQHQFAVILLQPIKVLLYNMHFVNLTAFVWRK